MADVLIKQLQAIDDNGDAQVATIAELTLVDGEVQVDATKPPVEQMVRLYVIVDGPEEGATIDDGQVWLDALPDNWQGKPDLGSEGMSFVVGDVDLGPSLQTLEELVELEKVGFTRVEDLMNAEGKAMPEGVPEEARRLLRTNLLVSYGALWVLTQLAGVPPPPPPAELVR